MIGQALSGASEGQSHRAEQAGGQHEHAGAVERMAIFALNLIPHTLEMTMLKHLQTGSRVNLEVDMIARYVERMMQFTQTTDKD